MKNTLVGTLRTSCSLPRSHEFAPRLFVTRKVSKCLPVAFFRSVVGVNLPRPSSVYKFLHSFYPCHQLDQPYPPSFLFKFNPFTSSPLRPPSFPPFYQHFYERMALNLGYPLLK